MQSCGFIIVEAIEASVHEAAGDQGAAGRRQHQQSPAPTTSRITRAMTRHVRSTISLPLSEGLRSTPFTVASRSQNRHAKFPKPVSITCKRWRVAVCTAPDAPTPPVSSPSARAAHPRRTPQLRHCWRQYHAWRTDVIKQIRRDGHDVQGLSEQTLHDLMGVVRSCLLLGPQRPSSSMLWKISCILGKPCTRLG